MLVGHPEWMEDQSLFLDRTALTPTIDAWIADRTVEEVLEEASAFRIPNAPITNGANATTWAHFRERGTFVANPKDGATNPGPPFRLGAGSLRAPEAAPRLGELRERGGGDTGAAGADTCATARLGRCPSRDCGSWT